ncbi:MAG: MarR family winged helix-turn-helix transcriptional regulator [Actinomycetes bacterium]
MQANDPTIDDLLKSIFRMVQAIKQTVHADPVERAAIIILSRLKENGSVRLSELANDLMLDISTVSRQARALEDRGLVCRAEDPADRRAVRLDLAPAGREVLAAAWKRRHDWLAESLADWSPDDRVALSATLTRFADALGAEPAPRPKTETTA